MARLATAINQYQTNNNGKVPEPSSTAADSDGAMPANTSDDSKKLIKTYLNSVNASDNEFLDPDGWAYGIKIVKLANNATPSGADAPNGFDHTAYIYTQAECEGEGAKGTTNPRDYAIVYTLEGSGTYCKDSR